MTKNNKTVRITSFFVSDPPEILATINLKSGVEIKKSEIDKFRSGIKKYFGRLFKREIEVNLSYRELIS